MATLENRIELVDGVSPTLSSIQRGAVDTTRALNGMSQARQGIDSLRSATTDLKTALGMVAENHIKINVDQLKASAITGSITGPVIQAVRGLDEPLNNLGRKAKTVATGMIHPFKAMAQATAVVMTYPAKALGNAMLDNIPIARRTFDSINSMARTSANVISTSLNNAYSGADSMFSLIEAKLNQSKNSASTLGRVLNSTFGQMTMANLAAGAISQFASIISSLPGKLIQASDEYSGMQARLRLVVGAGGDVEAMNKAIFDSAVRARGSYTQMADAVGKIAMTAKEAFPDPQEVVPFMEGIQKLFAIGGTDVEHQADALLQLTQALGSGKLQGDEFRSIAEAAPMIEQMVAKSLGVTQGALKQMSSDGEITAEVLKNAILGNMDYINEMFEGMPLKWSDIWQIGMTQVDYAFSGVFKKINDLANAPVVRIISQEAVNLVTAFGGALDVVMNNIQWIAESPATQQFVENVIEGFRGAGEAVQSFMNMLSENWAYIEPVIIGLGVAITIFAAIWVASHTIAAAASLAHAAALAIETAAIVAMIFAQDGLNAALYACPLTWIVAMIVALVVVFYLAIAAINKLAGTSISATGIIFAVFAWVFTSVANLVTFVINRFIDFANFLGSVFQDPLSAIYNLFAAIWSGVVDLVEIAVNDVISLIKAIPGSDKAAAILGVSLDPVSMGGLKVNQIPIDGYTPIEHVAYQSWVGNAKGAYGVGQRFETEGVNYLGDIMKNVFGGGVENKVKELIQQKDDNDNKPSMDDDSGKQTAGNTGRTADNTGKMADVLDAIDDEVKDWRDFANQEAIIKYTKQELAVSVGDINPTINQQQDIDGVIDYVTGYIMEGLSTGAEMVHA